MSDNETSKPEESEEVVKADEAEAPEELKLEAEVEASAPVAEESAVPVVAVKAEKVQEDIADESLEASAPVAEQAVDPVVETVKAEKVQEDPADEKEDVSPSTSAVLKKAEEKLKEFEKAEEEELIEKVVFINRCAKVVKGGRRFSFSALVVCGDQNGNVGYGFGKANEVADCIRKGSEISKKSMVSVALQDNTIPHEVIGEYGGGRVMLRPASPGTGIIAGGGVRAVVEAAGIKDVLAKSMGSNNHANVVKATLKALTSLRTREQIYKLRGKKMKEKAAL